MNERVHTVIIGGGQAGLAMSYYLTQQGQEHIILEQAARVAHVWCDERWDSFTLVSPNWSIRMPGAEYQGEAPDGFLHREEIVSILNNTCSVSGCQFATMHESRR